MFRKLTVKDKDNKKYYERVASQSTDNLAWIDAFEIRFHRAMQNPVDKTVSFGGVDRGLLHNGNLCRLSGYFSEANGEHIFGKTVETLRIINVYLKGYNRGLDQMPDGTIYIANLIERNPNIKTIDLTNTFLGDDEAKILLDALDKNTKLLELKLDNNLISKTYLDKINKKLEENKIRSISENKSEEKEMDSISAKLTKFLDQSTGPQTLSTNKTHRLFKFQERERMEREKFIGPHLSVMQEIKVSIKKI